MYFCVVFVLDLLLIVYNYMYLADFDDCLDGKVYCNSSTIICYQEAYYHTKIRNVQCTCDEGWGLLTSEYCITDRKYILPCWKSVINFWN